jgi:hypothetical protein
VNLEVLGHDKGLRAAPPSRRAFWARYNYL